MEGIKHRTINKNGISIRIAEKGNGPVVLSQHGFPDLYCPDKVKALVNLSVPFRLRNPNMKVTDAFRDSYGDEFYVCGFQEPGKIEAEFAQIGTSITRSDPVHLYLPEGKLLGQETDENTVTVHIHDFI